MSLLCRETHRPFRYWLNRQEEEEKSIHIETTATKAKDIWIEQWKGVLHTQKKAQRLTKQEK